MNTIGIDVDSKYLVCRIRRSGKDFPEARFVNDSAEWASQIDHVGNQG